MTKLVRKDLMGHTINTMEEVQPLLVFRIILVHQIITKTKEVIMIIIKGTMGKGVMIKLISTKEIKSLRIKSNRVNHMIIVALIGVRQILGIMGIMMHLEVIGVLEIGEVDLVWLTSFIVCVEGYINLLVYCH